MKRETVFDPIGEKDFIRKDLDNGIQGLQAGDIGLTDSVGAGFLDGILARGIKSVSRKRLGGSTRVLVHHAFMYFGSGKNEIVEAQSGGVKTAKIQSYMNKNSQFLIYRNKNLTVEQLAVLKDYMYGRVAKGIKYGYMDIVRFVLPFLPDNESTDFCSEVCVAGYGKIKIKTSRRKAKDSTPADMRHFFDSRAGQRAGWYCADSYNIAKPRPIKYP